MKIKRKSLYDNIKKIAAEAEIYDYKSGVMILPLVIACSPVLIAILYRLNLINIILVLIMGVCIFPVLVRYSLMQIKENRRFYAVDLYIHQMIYSFQRNPKINMALKDTLKISQGKMKKTIQQSLLELECGEKEDLYKYALEIIEKEYPCQKIKTLHRFMVSIEEKGGNYNNSLNILLTDFDRWVNRIYKYQKDVKRTVINSIVGVGIGYAVASMTVILNLVLNKSSDISLSITNDVFYQIDSLVFIFVNVLFCIFAVMRYSTNWMDEKRDDTAVMKDYNMVFGNFTKEINKFRKYILVLGLILSVILIIRKQTILFAAIFVIAVVFYFTPIINKKSAMARLKEDVYLGFTEWLREVVINMQSEPLIASIIDTYNVCPAVIKPSLKKFIVELEDNPTDVVPYYNFLNEFNIMDISVSVRTLFAVSELGSESIDRSMNTIISRNYELAHRHEEMKNKDSISVMKFREYIPMMFVACKIGVDMLLLVANYL